ncbi:hypothetical protein ACULNC_13895 [Shigella flexneri]
MVQVELFTDFTVVAFRGFFQALQVSVKCFFACPRRTVIRCNILLLLSPRSKPLPFSLV